MDLKVGDIVRFRTYEDFSSEYKMESDGSFYVGNHHTISGRYHHIFGREYEIINTEIGRGGTVYFQIRSNKPWHDDRWWYRLEVLDLKTFTEEEEDNYRGSQTVDFNFLER